MGPPIETFKLKGIILKKAGFLEIMNWQQTSDKEIPKYKVGDVVELKAIRVIEGKVRIFYISNSLYRLRHQAT